MLTFADLTICKNRRIVKLRNIKALTVFSSVIKHARK